MPPEATDSIKVPPQFIEGERAILGGLLLNNDALPKVVASLTSDDFYREAHRLVFEAMTELFNRNEPVDWVTVTAALRKEGTLESAGGIPFLTELVDAVPTAANIEHWAKVVKEKSLLRQIIAAATEIATLSYQDHPNIDEFLGNAEELIFRIGASRIRSAFVPIRQLMKEGIDTIEKLYDRKEAITGVPSGFRDLDQYTAGFQRSDLVIVAGRPSMGKTSLALNVAMNAAEEGVPSAIFSLEMSKEQIALRLLCSKARVNLKSLRTGYLNQDDWGRLITAAGVISEAPLYIDDTPAITSIELRAKARRLKKEKDLGLVVIDYLQLMKGTGRSDAPREQEISEISRSLKALAKELDVPVIALSQLNRKVEERTNKRPQLADLRESGAIEQDADVILFIYRDEVYNKSDENPKKGQAEIIIGKQRNGPIGMVMASFDAHCSTFRPFTARDDTPLDDSGILSNI